MAVVARKPPSLPLPSLFLSSPLAARSAAAPSSPSCARRPFAHGLCAHCMAPVVSTALPPLKAARAEGRKWNGKDKFGLRCLISRQLAGAGEGGAAAGKGFWGLREGPSLPLSPFLSLSPDCKFIVAWPRVFCSLIPQRERARPPARQRRYLLYFPRRGVRRQAGIAAVEA